ncbi:MAG TPA: hypothetical protein VM639_13580 [Dongiaceae bacterium]|nr:hypothetical protein [Dongiaceae bacterium]
MADEHESILLADRFEILAGERLSHLDSPGAQAFAVVDRHDSAAELFALIPPVHLACRAFAHPINQVTSSQMLWPLSAGIVDWPVSGSGEQTVWGRRPALVFTRPGGERVAANSKGTLPLFSEQQLLKNVLEPVLYALRDMGPSGATHRAIRPDNLFYQLGNSGPVVLGECFSMPPGYAQGAIFETIENAGCLPMARAPGTVADDLYALGALLLMLHLGRNPMAGMSEEQIILAKINYGSFAAMAGREKLPPSLAELLRGLLNDKSAERWNIRGVEGWMMGQHYSPVLPYLPQRATRAISFAGVEHVNKPSLGHAMSWHWQAAIQLVDQPDFDLWIRRSFNDEKALDTLTRIRGVSQSSGPSSGMRDRLVARMIANLAQPGPICYKDLRLSLNGLGTLLADIIDQQDQLNQFGDMMRARIHQAWIQEQPSLRPEQIQALRPLDDAEKFVDRPGYGYGIERALYELTPRTPCRSPLISDFYVTDLRDLLPALDAAMPALEPGTKPIDRHIAAFIAANLKRSLDRELSQLNNAVTAADTALAIMNLLAIVQGVHPTTKLPNLAQAMHEMLQPSLSLFHLAGTRERVAKQLDRHLTACDFGAVLLLFDPEGAVRRGDEIGFAAARNAYAHKAREVAWIENGGLTDPMRVRVIAQRTAAVGSALMASAGIAVLTLATLL